ncbi:hypothetical protein EV178_003690 [Coemansia sp. RSA 1646]|nr:hypothetical protein EV178_003690 [Coemansia sp. RSA 1646]
MDENNNMRDIINLSSTGDASITGSERLHQLPCFVDYDGPAKTSVYFLPEKQADLTYEASFRGRQLCGRKVTLPNSYIGHVLVESTALPHHGSQDMAFESDVAAATPTNDEQRELRSVGQFEELTVWEHDRVPLQDDDEFICSLQWVALANSIHADCTSTQVTSCSSEAIVAAD